MVSAQKNVAVHFLFGAIATYLVCGVDAIREGQLGSRCDVPGLTVVINSFSILLCTGVMVDNGQLLLTADCHLILKGANMAGDVEVITGNKHWTIPQSSYNGEVINGIVTLSMIDRSFNEDTSNCHNIYGSLFDGSEALNTTTCKVVGLGPEDDTTSFLVYNTASQIRSVPIAKSTSVKCCAAIMDTIPQSEKGAGYNDIYPYNCFTPTNGNTCTAMDIGGPVMCDTVSGKKVTIGLTASVPCESNKVFLAYDLTNESEDVKFGTF